ncbi:MAG: hypothetical protein SOX32_05700 [Candidatus Choladocola sp.]|nr:hypothetical protein [Candidatus Choladocola sp.]
MKNKKWILMVAVFMMVFAGVMPVQAASAKWKKACQAYKTYLAKNESRFVANTNTQYRNNESYRKTSCFMISDLDGNGVPELITLHCWGFRDSSVYVFSYKNGKVTRVKNTKGKYVDISECSWANGGYSTWICNRRHIHVKWSGFSGYHEYVYRMSGGKLKLYMERDVDNFIKKYRYTVNGKKVSKSSFNKQIKKCKHISKGEFVRNNKTNRSRYLK